MRHRAPVAIAVCRLSAGGGAGAPLDAPCVAPLPSGGDGPGWLCPRLVRLLRRGPGVSGIPGASGAHMARSVRQQAGRCKIPRNRWQTGCPVGRARNECTPLTERGPEGAPLVPNELNSCRRWQNILRLVGLRQYWQALSFAPKITRTPHVSTWFCRSLWPLSPLCSQNPGKTRRHPPGCQSFFLGVPLCLCASVVKSSFLFGSGYAGLGSGRPPRSDPPCE